SLTEKRLELVDALERHTVDITYFQETKWKGSSNIEGNGYKLWYLGSSTAINGVGVILKACLKDKVVLVNRCSDMIISLTLVIDEETVNVISAYAPQVGLSEVEKKTFWDSLDKVVREFTTDQRLILGGDLNGHIWAATEGYTSVYRGFGFGMRNEEGRAILDFAIAHDLVVVNSHFKKRDHHLVTFQSGGRCTQIDYLLVRRGDLKACKHCRVFPREACSSQDNLLKMDFLFKSVQRKREGSALPRILSRVADGVSTRVEALVACDADSMWNTLASIIKDAAKDTLRVAIGTLKTQTVNFLSDNRLVNITRDMIISLTLVIDEETVSVISAYAPQVGLSEVEKKTFWDSLDKVVREFSTDQRLILGGDLNGPIGAATEGYTSVYRGFRSRVADGVSTRVEALVACDANSMWNTLASIIKDAAKDTLRVAIGTLKTHTARRESWWLSEEVQVVVAVKQARFRELLSCRAGNEEERLRAHERYKEAKRQAKNVVAQAKEKAYEYLYKKLDTKEGANDIFRTAKARERRRRDLGDICYIKDKEGQTITDDEEIKKRWREYLSSLFNAREQEGMGPSSQPHPECYYSRISQAKVRTALQKMGRNKAVGPDQIPIEAWRSLWDEVFLPLSTVTASDFSCLRHASRFCPVLF
nr:hypothetical protein [Tanacetum cinerariifolium]